MKYILACLVMCSLSIPAYGQQPVEMPLWPDGSPESNKISDPEISENNFFVRNISEGRLYVYRPEAKKNTGTAVVICPGGGYGGEAMWHEGHDFAKWLAERGITGIVLKYRLPNRIHYIPLKDAQQALRTIRSNAKEWNIKPDKVGIAGFSAGGHLASTAGTHFNKGNPAATKPMERISSRPDFMLLFYPVITMREEFTHIGSRQNILGEGYQAELIQLYSNELHVTKDTPPAFLILSDDDQVVVPRNSIEFYSALKVHGIASAMYILPSGGHGWGTNPSQDIYIQWAIPLENWLKYMHLIPSDK